VHRIGEHVHTKAGPATESLPEPDRYGSVRGLSTSGFHKIAYADWGPVDAETTVVCVHGLTRQAREFDYLASALAARGYRVVCPDLVGRGRSDWLPNVLDYVFPQYCADMATLLATLGTKKIHWIGTSLGGLIGMVLTGMSGSPVSSLVVNDIGPDVPTSAVARVGFRIAQDPRSYSSIEEAERYNRKTFAACGALTDAQWRHFTVHSLRRDEAGNRYVPALDPKVGTAYGWLWYYQMTLWQYWDKIRVPILAIRGAESDFVPEHLIREMKRRAPQMEIHEVAGAGHMPMLMSVEEIGVVSAFLSNQEHGHVKAT
jgi:pimeloyl-ACP methyl ester carboxylesterase